MSSIARKLTGKDFSKHLHDKLDGYVQVVQFENDKIINSENYKKSTLREIRKVYTGAIDTFLTVNSSYNGKRGVRNIRQLRALYIDLDNRGYTFSELFYSVWGLYLDGKIPEPTMVVDSGRGAHIYWRIEHAPYQALATWQELEDYLWYQLKELGADKKAIDAARVLRLPDTINSRSNTKCAVMVMNDEITHSMYDLREKYLKWKPKVFKTFEVEEKFENKKVKRKVVQFFTSYTLHMARAEDILKLCELRNYDVKGYRNMILHCYVYWLGVTHRNKAELEEMVNELNNKFIEPIAQSALKSILRCIPNAIGKFMAYEQGMRSGEVKRVSKGMRDKGGYWYKNETLIDRLDITREEQKHMKTIIGTEVKYDRRNIKKKNARRNEDGLTKKQIEMQELKFNVLKLKEQGLSNIKIATILGKNKSTIGRILK